VFRSKSIGFEEEKMELAPIPPPHTVWEPSVVTEEQIQDRGWLEAGGG
jgi:hypothetical protein